MEQAEFEKEWLKAEKQIEAVLIKFKKNGEVASLIAEEMFDAMEFIQERVADEYGFDYWELELSK